MLNTNTTVETKWLEHLDVIILKAIVIIITICLNSLVVFVFTCLIPKRTYTNYLFLSISISDLGIGLIAMTTQVISDIDIQWPLGVPLCLFAIFSQQALPDITVQALLSLTIQRYMQLRYPMVACERLSACNRVKLVALWTVSPLFWCACLVAFAHHGLIDTSEQQCHLVYPGVMFVLVKSVMFGVVPLTLIACLNAQSISLLYNKKYRMLNRARTVRFLSAPTLKLSTKANMSPRAYGGASGAVARRMRSKSMLNKNKRRNSKCDDKVLLNMRRLNYAKINRNLKALGCLFALTVSVVLTQIPFIIMWPIHVYFNNNSTMEEVTTRVNSIAVARIYNLAVWIAYLTSLINSILIFVFNKTAKRELMRFLKRRPTYRNPPINLNVVKI